MKYQYYEVPGGTGKSVCKPWIPVRVGYKDTHKVTTKQIPAVVDSGADVCFCSEDIGLWLGVKHGRKEPLQFWAADNKPFSAYKEMITLYVCEVSYECAFYFTTSLPSSAQIILGQQGFFDHFRISFDLKNKEIEVV